MKAHFATAIACLLILLTSLCINAKTIAMNRISIKLRRCILIGIIFFLEMICIPKAQAQQGTWERYYRQTMNVSEGGYDVCEAGPGYSYLTGYAMVHNGVGGDRLWVIKIDEFGDSVWSRIYYDIPRIGKACVPTSDHGLIVTGTAAGAYFVKIDSSGNIVWERTFGSSLTQPKDMITLNDGSVVACGSVSFDSATVMKISSYGVLIWQTKMLFGRRTSFNSIDKSVSGGIVVHGSQANTFGTNNSFLSFFSEEGDFLNKMDFLKGGSKVRSIESGYLISGISNLDSLSIQIGFGFLRTDSLGNTIHQRYYYDKDLIACTEFQVVNSNCYLLALTVDRGESLHTRILLTDSMGNIRRENILRSAGYMEIPSSMILTNGNILFIGTADRYPDSWEDLYAAMTDSNLSYQPLGIGNFGSHINEKIYSLYQNYPNPFNSITNIRFELQKPGKVEISLYDLNGRKIIRLTDANYAVGSHQVQANLENQASGIYFYTFMLDAIKRESRKLILLK